MRVLIGCEFSGIVRDAFRLKGHDAWSCDLLPTERPGPHFQMNLRNASLWVQPWDLLVAHPPCTLLTRAGARWWKGRENEQDEALRFCKLIMSLPVPRIAMENPIGILSTRYRKPDQIIQPWQFGHGETKATCLWLKNLPPLKPTKIVEGREPRVHWAKPGADRWKRRSRTLQGIANAMADQWGTAMQMENWALTRGLHG